MPSVSELATASIRAYQDAVRTKTRSLIWPVHNVMGYGAVGDGTTDDTTAIQEALTAAIAEQATLYLPPARYLISDSLTGTVSGRLHILADNAILETSEDVAMLSLSGDEDFPRDLQIVGLTCKWTGTGVGATGIQLSRFVFPILENLYLENLTTGIDIDSSVDIIYFTTISNCDIESCTTGINFDATCANWQVMRGRIKNCTTGISANSPNGLVERVDIEQNTAGIHVNERNIVLFKCHLENNTAHVTYGVNHSQFTAQWNEVALPYTLEEPGDGRYQFKENWRTDTTPALPVSRRTMYQDRDGNVYMLEAPWSTAREFRLYNVTDSAEIWRFNSDGDMFVVLGDMETETAGKGLVVKTPDSTKRYRIAVDNAGAVTSTLLT